MSIIELRHTIFEQLSHIEDVSFLEALKTIVESKTGENIYELNSYEKERIDSARKQLKNKQTISHDELQSEVNQWLNSK